MTMERTITPREAALLTGYSYVSIMRHMRKGNILYTEVDGQKLLDRDQVIAWWKEWSKEPRRAPRPRAHKPRRRKQQQVTRGKAILASVDELMVDTPTLPETLGDEDAHLYSKLPVDREAKRLEEEGDAWSEFELRRRLERRLFSLRQEEEKVIIALHALNTAGLA